jgi:hypothetical protein
MYTSHCEKKESVKTIYFLAISPEISINSVFSLKLDLPTFTLFQTSILPFAELIKKLTIKSGHYPFVLPDSVHLPFSLPEQFSEKVNVEVSIINSATGQQLGCIDVEIDLYAAVAANNINFA